MRQKEYLSCPSCNRSVTIALPEAMVVICRNCHALVKHDLLTIPSMPAIPAKVPADWSFIQIGTTGTYREKSFTITGRVRLQLRNEYKNFWSAVHDGNKSLWIMESFGSFCVLEPRWYSYTGDIKKLRATHTITVENGDTLTGDYVDKCEAISIEGQVGRWPELFPTGFFVVQGSRDTDRGFFTVHTKTKIVQYMLGKTVTPEDLKLGTIHEWNEWR